MEKNNDDVQLSERFVDEFNERLALRTGEMPVIITSPGLKQRSFPYSRPLQYSKNDEQAVFNRCRSYNPIDDLLTASVTGPGAMTVGLDGAPGAATSVDRSAYIPGFLIDVAINANVSPSPFTLSAAGFTEDGAAYALPSTEFIWTPDANNVEQILILGCENTVRGPMLRALQLTTNDYPAQFLGNGAAAMAAGRQLVATVSAAPAGMAFALAAITAQHAAYDLLRQVLAVRLSSDAPKVEAGARMRDILPPRVQGRILTGRIPVAATKS